MQTTSIDYWSPYWPGFSVSQFTLNVLVTVNWKGLFAFIPYYFKGVICRAVPVICFSRDASVVFVAFIYFHSGLDAAFLVVQKKKRQPFFTKNR